MNDTDSPQNPDPIATDRPRNLAEIRRNGNHLVNEPSLYLQQHAHNPINWYPWGDEALQRSRDQGKPIFLSIGYSSCHWCHVMEHEVFEQDDVATFMNAHFVCIKVDREERPDLDAVYMEAVQLLTGRGGWPMSVFLTPEMKPFYGGTYFPKPQFLSLTARIEELFRERPEDVQDQAEQLTAHISRPLSTNTSPAKGIQSQMLAKAVAAASREYDRKHGGFRQTQKFPTPARWRFLLHEYRHQADQELGEMIVQTCQAMAQGGLYDHVGGGFHRYCVDTGWTVPHFEKMLYDNGQLAGLMLEAGVVFERDDLVATGLDVLDFLLSRMRSDEGGFYASFDADSDGKEGSYYVWDQADITTVVGPTDGPLLAAVLGVTDEGNFEYTGKSVLTRRADLERIAARSSRPIEELEGLFTRHRSALRSAREERISPGLDHKVVTSWNGLAIAALAQGYAVTGVGKYLTGAEKAADFLLREHRRDDGSLWRASSDGRLTAEGVLDDYAFLADGLLELYQVSGRMDYLTTARELVDYAVEHFGRKQGVFFMSRTEVKAPLGRRVDYFDSVIPSGNAVMMVNLVRLAAITGETGYRTRALNDLDRTADLLSRTGLEMAWWLEAVRKITGPYYDVVIAGDRNHQADDGLVRTLISRLPSSAVVSQLPAGGITPELAELAPALAGKTAIDGKPTAYVCEFGTCRAPTHDLSLMMEQALKGWRK